MLLFGGYYKEMKHKKLYDSSKAAGGKAVDDPDEPRRVQHVMRMDCVRPPPLPHRQQVLALAFQLGEAHVFQSTRLISLRARRRRRPLRRCCPPLAFLHRGLHLARHPLQLLAPAL